MTTTPVYSNAVQTLLNRMDSNPKEFIGKGGKWLWVMRDVEMRVLQKHQSTDTYRLGLPFLTNDEVNALYDKWMLIQKESFEHRVMRDILEPEASMPFAETVEQAKLEAMKNIYGIPNNVRSNPYAIPQELIDQYRSYANVGLGAGLTNMRDVFGGVLNSALGGDSDQR